jgi:molecular chaperone GrpE
VSPDRRKSKQPPEPTGDPIDTGELPVEPASHHLDEGWEPTDSVPAREAAIAVQEVEDRFLRLAAEYDNYRKRTTREKAEAFDKGAAAFAGRLLDSLDDLDRLLGSDPATTDGAAVREGLALIARKLAKELGAAGLEAIDAAGGKFDPNEQDAVALAIPDDPALDDTVAAIFQKGYRFRGAVLRPAKVQVFSVDGAI